MHQPSDLLERFLKNIKLLIVVIIDGFLDFCQIDLNSGLNCIDRIHHFFQITRIYVGLFLNIIVHLFVHFQYSFEVYFHISTIVHQILYDPKRSLVTIVVIILQVSIVTCMLFIVLFQIVQNYWQVQVFVRFQKVAHPFQ